MKSQIIEIDEIIFDNTCFSGGVATGIVLGHGHIPIAANRDQGDIILHPQKEKTKESIEE